MHKFVLYVFFWGLFLLPYSLIAMDKREGDQSSAAFTATSSSKVLEGVSETLLIPLYGRSLETERADGVIKDLKAVEIIKRIKEELPTLQITCSPQLQLGLTIRTQILDERVSEFLSSAPNGNIINLGAGLCTRFFRVDNGQCSWTELDLPQVNQLWHQLYQETDRHKFIQGSVTETDWFDKVIIKPEAKTLIIAEGLLMYFSEEVVHSILSNLTKRFPGADMVFDVVGIPEFMTTISDWIFPDLRGVKFGWGANTNASIEQRKDLSIVGSWLFLDRCKERWSQTTKSIYLYSLPGMGPGPRVLHLKFNT